MVKKSRDRPRTKRPNHRPQNLWRSISRTIHPLCIDCGTKLNIGWRRRKTPFGISKGCGRLWALMFIESRNQRTSSKLCEESEKQAWKSLSAPWLDWHIRCPQSSKRCIGWRERSFRPRLTPQKVNGLANALFAWTETESWLTMKNTDFDEKS